MVSVFHAMSAAVVTMGAPVEAPAVSVTEAVFGPKEEIHAEMIEAAPAPAAPQVIPGTRSPIVRGNSAFGPTGLIAVPTAYSAAQGTWQFGAFFGRGFRGPSVNYGIIPYVEVGGAYINRDGGDDKVIGNAKVTIIPANFRNFEVGIGVIDVANAIEQSWYAVGSVDLIVPPAAEQALDTNFTRFRVHGGVGTGMFRSRLFAGAELAFDNRFSIIGEWDGRDFNGAVRYAHDDNFNVKAGFHGTHFFVGASYIMRF
jgi:hypothetical protein